MRTTITAGTLKGRPLELEKSESVRPTQNKLRQAAFNMLLSRVDIEGAHILDLCCGSGAYGLEALSRGASYATLVDTNPATAQTNITNLKLTTQAEALKAGVLTFTPTTLAHVIFADPPYASATLTQLLARHATLGAPGSFWLIEYENRNPPTIPTTLTLLKDKKHGDKTLALLQAD